MERVLITRIGSHKLEGIIREHFKIEFYKDLAIIMPYVVPDEFLAIPGWDDEARLWLVMTLGFKNMDVDIGLVFDHRSGFARCDPDHPKNKEDRRIIDEGLAHLATLPNRWI